MQDSEQASAIPAFQQVWIPMPDGAVFAGRLWLPAGLAFSKVPVVLEWIPYRQSDLTAVGDSMPVSYTHLDVYKRQDYRSDWATLDGVEIRDRCSGVIHLKQPFSPLFKSTLPYGSGMIVCKRAVEAHGGRIDTDPFATSGPYQLISWVPRERLVLRRNPLWNGPRPYYDEIHLFPMSMNEGQTAFDAGDLDIARLNTSAIGVARATAGKDATVTVRHGLDYHWLGMNVENPKLRDLRVRRAIQHAVNVPEVTRAVFGDDVGPAYGAVPPPLPGARMHKRYNFDPDEARRLLKAAGVEQLNLRLDLSNDEAHVSAALVVQAQLAAVGIAVEVRSMDTASFITARQTLSLIHI